MTSGVSIFSQAANATWAVNVGAADANYPASNLADLINICNPVKVTTVSNAFELQFVLSAAASVQIVALVRHTINGGTVRLRLWSDNNPDPVGNAAHIVYDSTAVSTWPGGSGQVPGYAATRPFLLANPVTCGSGLLDFTGVGGVPQIGGVEIGQFLPWDVSEGANYGFVTDANDITFMGGASDSPITNLQRIAEGKCDFVSSTISTRTSIDFMQTTGLQRPFVFVQNYEDPTTWARWTFLARNSDIPPLIGAIFGWDQFEFRLKEHVR